VEARKGPSVYPSYLCTPFFLYDSPEHHSVHRGRRSALWLLVGADTYISACILTITKHNACRCYVLVVAVTSQSAAGNKTQLPPTCL
jgi:hypothetical protein